MRGTGVSFNTTLNSSSQERGRNLIEGFNQSISTPAARLRFKRMNDDNRVLGHTIINMKPVVSFRKNSYDYEQQQIYKKQISHFGQQGDQTFKRFFSGFGLEGRSHHG